MKPVQLLSTACAIFIALLPLSFTSCTEVETRDVPGPTVHDTVHGPTLMRFIAMMPDAKPVYLKKSRSGSAPIYLTVTAGSFPQYIIIPDSGIVFYLFRNLDSCYDSLPLPAY